ncbi:MAG: electron transfer flavoprotein-ubiquinone oxidoreductase [Planctomycetes bacterium]|nr:electron transfer flavoprotein-ubiquinone oxidoreductase [Planctomycetota bacterium]
MEPPPPFDGPALHDKVQVMFAGGASIPSPIVPPTFHNDGNQIMSLNRFVKWLGAIAEEKGVTIMPDFPGAEVLYEKDTVKGVRTADKGRDKDGAQKGSFEPGTDLLAGITIFGEGSRGSLTKTVIERYDLAKGRNPQIYSTGIKEVWKLPEGRLREGQVIHTVGAPLSFFGDEFGGGWIYALADNHVSIGFVASLDSPDPAFDPHRKFSEWKSHPFLSKILEGGEIVRFGAKTIPEGGWFSLPRPYMPGAVLVGDSAGFVNMTRLKGIHLSMKSGMCAGETAFEVIRDATAKAAEAKEDLEQLEPASEEQTRPYWHRLLDSWLFEELWAVRNFRQAFQKRPFGFLRGNMNAGLHVMSGGLWPPGRLGLEADYRGIQKLKSGASGWSPPPAKRATVSAAAEVAASRKDGVRSKAPPSGPASFPEPTVKTEGVVFDKVTDVYHSGAIHEEDQPAHLVVADLDVCHTRCPEEYGNPCQYFCPAGVYEMAATDDGSGRQLRLNFSNCVHCKTCDIRDPYQIITWVTPESGGPTYAGL